MPLYPPERLRAIRQRCDERVIGKKLNMWVTLYEYNMEQIPNLKPWLDEFDYITLWIWYGRNLEKMESYYEDLFKMCPDKKIVAGMFMYNYGERCPMTIEQMKRQGDYFLKLMREGKLDGIMIVGNPICDLGLEAVEWTRNWIQEHKYDVFD